MEALINSQFTRYYTVGQYDIKSVRRIYLKFGAFIPRKFFDRPEEGVIQQAFINYTSRHGSKKIVIRFCFGVFMYSNTKWTLS